MTTRDLTRLAAVLPEIQSQVTDLIEVFKKIEPFIGGTEIGGEIDTLLPDLEALPEELFDGKQYSKAEFIAAIMALKGVVDFANANNISASIVPLRRFGLKA